MKHTAICTIILLLLNSIAYSAITTIKGSIRGSVVQSIEIVKNKIFITGSEETVSVNVIDGKFEFSIDINSPTELIAKSGKINLKILLFPGETMEINYSDGGDFTFGGIRAAEHSFYLDFCRQFESEYSIDNQHEQMFALNIDAFEMKLFDQQKKQISFLEAAVDKSILSSDFLSFVNNKISYHYGQLLLAYPIVRGNKNIKIPKVEQLPTVILSPLLTLEESDNLLVLDDYRAFIYYKTIYLTSVENNYDKFTVFDISVSKKADYVVKNYHGESYLYLMTKILTDHCSKCKPATIRRMIDQIGRSENAVEHINFIEQKCEEALNATDIVESKVNKPSKKSATTSTGKSGLQVTGVDGKQFSIDDLKGKVLYVDFWATWCGPCRQQFPYAKKLKESLDSKQGKQILFVYISIDSKESTWKQGIEKYGITGKHGFSEGGWNSTAVKHFGINSIPRYMIFDKSGKLVDGNAKRPGDPQLLNDLLKLL